MEAPISAAQQTDLLDLDLELSHDYDDVSKPVENDDSALFPDYQTVEQDDVNENLLGSSSTQQNDTKISMGSLGSTTNTKTPPNENEINPSNARCWNVEYYQTYFDIDTSQELYRLKKALFPFLSGQFYDKELNDKPDLYGPFWITTTLAFLMAAMGNFSSYINSDEIVSGEWNGDITRISEAATFLYTGIVLVPSILYLVLRTYEETSGLIELVSLYGYSLMPFIVACILCIAPWNFFDWIVVITAMCSSILFLIKNIYKPLSDEKKSRP
eukprot:220852_1